MSITSSRPLSSALALFHAVLNSSTHGAISRPSRTSQHWVRLSTTEIFNMLFSVPPWKRQPACQTAAAASLLNSKSVRALLLPRALRPRLHRLLQLPIYVGAGCNSAFRLQWPYQTHPH